MQAIILVGGLGTRLRPLTNNIPKAVVPMMNQPFLTYQLKLFAKHGIKDVILSVCHLSDYLKSCLSREEKYGLNLTYISEETPLGTAGAIKNCGKLLKDTFLVMTGDLLTTINLNEMKNFHHKKNAFITMCTKELDDPTGYGLVKFDSNRRITRFIEKPGDWREFNTNSINTAVWFMDLGVLDFIPSNVKYSAEYELFPALLKARKPFYSYPTSEYWLDFGNPSKYMQAHRAFFDGQIEFDNAIQISEKFWVEDKFDIYPGMKFQKPLYIGKNCYLGKEIKIGNYTVLGSNVKIGEQARITNSIIWENTVIGKGASIENCILCTDCHIGNYVQLSNCVLGDKAIIPNYSKMAEISSVVIDSK